MPQGIIYIIVCDGSMGVFFIHKLVYVEFFELFYSIIFVTSYTVPVRLLRMRNVSGRAAHARSAVCAAGDRTTMTTVKDRDAG